GVIGNFVSGKVEEAQLTKKLMLTFGLLAIVLISFTFLLQVSVLTFVISFLFGAGTFGTTPLLNSKIILTAIEAPMLSGTIAADDMTGANFLGATFGTFLLNQDFTYSMITFVAAGVIVFGLMLTIVTYKVENRAL